MPQWIHDRAEHLRAKNPSMSESEAWAIATQQSHALGKTPKSYGTVQGRTVAKKKYRTPGDDETKAKGHREKTAMIESFKRELEKIAEHPSFKALLVKIAMGWDVETGGHSPATLQALAQRQGYTDYNALRNAQTQGAQRALTQTDLLEKTHPALQQAAGKSDRQLEVEWAQQYAARKEQEAAAARDAMPGTGVQSPMAMRKQPGLAGPSTQPGAPALARPKPGPVLGVTPTGIMRDLQGHAPTVPSVPKPALAAPGLRSGLAGHVPLKGFLSHVLHSA